MSEPPLGEIQETTDRRQAQLLTLATVPGATSVYAFGLLE